MTNVCSSNLQCGNGHSLAMYRVAIGTVWQWALCGNVQCGNGQANLSGGNEADVRQIQKLGASIYAEPDGCGNFFERTSFHIMSSCIHAKLKIDLVLRTTCPQSLQNPMVPLTFFHVISSCVFANLKLCRNSVQTRMVAFCSLCPDLSTI